MSTASDHDQQHYMNTGNDMTPPGAMAYGHGQVPAPGANAPATSSAMPRATRSRTQAGLGGGSSSGVGMSIAAQSEEEKYEGKYRELKKKVRDIEMENDKLQVKVLKAKRGIQRLRMERAILYERLATLTPQGPGAAPGPVAPPPPPGSLGSGMGQAGQPPRMAGVYYEGGERERERRGGRYE